MTSRFWSHKYFILLDLNAAFDWVSHSILLDHTEIFHGISVTAVMWSSYLTECSRSDIMGAPRIFKTRCPTRFCSGPAFIYLHLNVVAWTYIIRKCRLGLCRNFNQVWILPNHHCMFEQHQNVDPAQLIKSELLKNWLRWCQIWLALSLL